MRNLVALKNIGHLFKSKGKLVYTFDVHAKRLSHMVELKNKLVITQGHAMKRRGFDFAQNWLKTESLENESKPVSFVETNILSNCTHYSFFNILIIIRGN